MTFPWKNIIDDITAVFLNWQIIHLISYKLYDIFREILFDILSFATSIFGYLHNRVVTFSFTTGPALSKDKPTIPKNLL